MPSQPLSPGVAAALERRAFDRRVFLASSIAFAAIVLAGFSRTYYLKTLFHTAALPSMLVHVHGLLMTAWVVLFIVQVRLVSANRVRLHQRLGYAGVGLALAILATGLPMALRAGKFGSASTPPAIPALSFLVVPLFDLLMFALLFGGAVYYRRRPAAHKGLMLLTAVNLLPPALGRMPVPALLALGPLWFFGVPTVLGLTYVVLDARRHHRVNRVALTGLLLLVASYVVRLAIMTTAPWLSFAAWATSFV
jgi:hypothetical protein